MLIERLTADKQLRRLCGWKRPGQVSDASIFSRAFATFARSELPSRVHAALIKRTHQDRLVGHISRDATAIEAREKPVKLAAPPQPKRQRPKKGEVVENKLRRLERQATMSPPMAVSAISGLLTSASLHDSQAAIPLARLTAARLTNLYDLTDSAYDAPEIAQTSRDLGHAPIIDKNPRRTPSANAEYEAETRRRADLRSTLAIDRLTVIRARPNLTPTTPRTAELRPKIANASHLPHRDPMQACKKRYALSLRVVNCRNPNSHWRVLQLARPD
jgi:hypothetical protein